MKKLRSESNGTSWRGALVLLAGVFALSVLASGSPALADDDSDSDSDSDVVEVCPCFTAEMMDAAHLTILERLSGDGLLQPWPPAAFCFDDKTPLPRSFWILYAFNHPDIVPAERGITFAATVNGFEDDLDAVGCFMQLRRTDGSTVSVEMDTSAKEARLCRKEIRRSWAWRSQGCPLD